MEQFSCCWPMGASAIKGDYTVLQAANTNWSSMSCEGCNVKFTLLRRKKTCGSCGHFFCVSCMKRFKSTSSPARCLKCCVLSAVPLDRNAIMGLKIRDLRWFLDTHKIPAHGCKEKSELVELVMHHGALHNASSAYPQNYERHTVHPEWSHTPSSDRVSAEAESVESSPLLSHQNSDLHSVSHSSIPGAIRAHSPDIEEQESEDGFVLVDSFAEALPSDQAESTPEQSKEEELKTNEPFTPLSLDDIKSSNQIMELTVRQLKLILMRNYVGFKGCCEKQELQTRVRQLWEQKQKAKDVVEIPDENLCKICMENVINSVLLDCGHVVSCTECGKRLHECPICRQYVVRVVHIFKA